MQAALFVFTGVSNAVYKRDEIRERALPWEQTDHPGAARRRLWGTLSSPSVALYFDFLY